MKVLTILSTIILAMTITTTSAQKSLRKRAILNSKSPKTLAEVKKYAEGQWKSISVELRPTEDRTGSGNILPTYLKRDFTFVKDDTFVGIITLFGDNYGQLPLLEFEFKGHLVWGDEHPVAEGAWKIDYVLDKGFGVTPLNPQAAAMLNQALPKGMSPFENGIKKDILKRAFPMFHIEEGQVVSDYDLIYFKNGLLFMGAKHVDGTPFDKIENRPHQLQIPLERVYK